MDIASKGRVMQSCELILRSFEIDPLSDILRWDIVLGFIKELIEWLLFILEHSHVQKGKSITIDKFINFYFCIDLRQKGYQLLGIIFLYEFNTLISMRFDLFLMLQSFLPFQQGVLRVSSSIVRDTWVISGIDMS